MTAARRHHGIFDAKRLDGACIVGSVRRLLRTLALPGADDGAEARRFISDFAARMKRTVKHAGDWSETCFRATRRAMGKSMLAVSSVDAKPCETFAIKSGCDGSNDRTARFPWVFASRQCSFYVRYMEGQDEHRHTPARGRPQW